jgi:hypothetical protein
MGLPGFSFLFGVREETHDISTQATSKSTMKIGARPELVMKSNI